jgi:hypothetical protein
MLQGERLAVPTDRPRSGAASRGRRLFITNWAGFAAPHGERRLLTANDAGDVASYGED